jgi:threonylcarbamoyladenosine tRNA methylthiotransferase MtaB
MENRKKVAFYTLGCKLNFSETSTIARNFQDEGFDRVDFEEVADMYVINTCSVTENADKQFKQVVKKAMKLNNKAFVAAIGCYAQLKPEELAAVDGVESPIISMICLKMILAKCILVKSKKLIFMLGVILLATELVLS